VETLFDVIWGANSEVGRILVLVIFAVAIYAARCAIMHTGRYRLFETTNLSCVERSLGEAQTHNDDGPWQEEQQSRLAKIVSIDRLRESAKPNSIIGDRLTLLAQLRASQVKVSVAALQEISSARESSIGSLRFPGFAVGLLMLIGLLGTFVGIAMIVQHISVSDTSTLEAVRGQIGGALVGMKTKFSTTMVALFCAILLSLLNFRLAQVQSIFFERLDRFTNAQLLPATIPAVEDETLLEKISLQLENSFSRLDDLAKQNVEHSAEMNAIQTGFASVVQNLRDTMRSDSPERIQMVIGKLSAVLEQVVGMNESVRGMVASVPTAIANMSDSMKRLTELLSDVPRRFQQQSVHANTSDPPMGVSSGWPIQAKILVGVLISINVVVLLIAILR
jgi:biopolymer transport protein ExbB/TolQ